MSNTSAEDLTSVQYSSSDESVATFEYYYEWDENKNGTLEPSEKVTVGDASDGEIILLSTGTTTITLTFRIKHRAKNGSYVYLPITLSYTLTVQENE